MAIDFQNASTEPSMAALVGGIVQDAQNLIKQEVALARSEIGNELKKTKEAAISLGIGIGVAALGALLLIFMLVFLLNEEADLKVWHSFGIVGGLLFILGAGLFFLGRARASEIHLVPPQTAQTMKENVQWLKNQT